MTFWLERLVAKIRIPYQLFFTLEGCLLYGIGLIGASLTGNLHEFITEPKWACFIALQASAGAMVVYALRKFDYSLNRLNPTVALSAEQFNEVKRQLRKTVTLPIYWLLVAFVLTWFLSCIFIVGNGLLDWGNYAPQWVWWGNYNSPSLFYLYYELISLLWIVVVSIYLWVVAIGLNLAYAKLCFKTPFHGMPLLTLGTRIFDGFARLTIITFAGIVVGGLSYFYLWGPIESPSIWTHSSYLPVGGIYALAMALPAIILPHCFFSLLLSRNKKTVLSNIELEIMALISKGMPASGKKQERQLISLNQSKTAVESARTSLLNVRIVIEFVLVNAVNFAIMLLIPHL